jgi:hypothetical protein
MTIENITIKDIKTTLKQLQKKERLLKKLLLEKLVKELDLTENDLKDFEKVRNEAWKKEKKKLEL